MSLIHRSIRAAVAAGVAWVLLAGPIPGCDPVGEHYAEEPAALISDGQAGHDTTLTPVLETPIVSGQNVVWCGSFQLAWNQLCELAGGKVQFQGQAPAVAAILNGKEVNSADFDSDSYVAAAGLVRDGIEGRIRRAMAEKFHGQYSPNLPKIGPFSKIPQDSAILSATEDTKFQMSEKGVKLESESSISIGCSASGPLAPRYELIFDKPFLILMQRKSAGHPCFAAWIGNGRLLIGAR